MQDLTSLARKTLARLVAKQFLLGILMDCVRCVIHNNNNVIMKFYMHDV